MRKLSICFGLILSLFCTQGFSKMAWRPQFEVNTLDAKNYWDGVVKTRPLTEAETVLRNLSLVANELKVETYLSSNKDPSFLQPQNVSLAMIKKMQEHPKWDVALSSQSLKTVNGHLDQLKTSFGQKSYGWAWVLNQRGEKAEAKKILLEVYEIGFQRVMGMSELRFDNSSPLSEMQFVQEALRPMLDSQWNASIESKMQKMKNHFSNLPSSMIKT